MISLDQGNGRWKKVYKGGENAVGEKFDAEDQQVEKKLRSNYLLFAKLNALRPF